MTASAGCALRQGLIPWLAGVDSDNGSPRRRVARLSATISRCGSRPLIQRMVEQRLLDGRISAAGRRHRRACRLRMKHCSGNGSRCASGCAPIARRSPTADAAQATPPREWEAKGRRDDWLQHSGALLDRTAEQAKRSELKSLVPQRDRRLSRRRAIVRRKDRHGGDDPVGRGAASCRRRAGRLAAHRERRKARPKPRMKAADRRTRARARS